MEATPQQVAALAVEKRICSEEDPMAPVEQESILVPGPAEVQENI